MSGAEFIPIDFETWPRRETFWYFSKMAPTGWSVTVETDITELLAFLKE